MYHHATSSQEVYQVKVRETNITEKVYQQSIQIYDRKQLSLNISSKGDQGERTSSTFS